MKKTLALVLVLLLLLVTAACGSSSSSGSIVSGSGQLEFSSSLSSEELPPPPESPDAVGSTSDARPPQKEVRSVWISYIELEKIMTGKGSDDYRSSISEMMDRCVDFGLNTVVFHVRPFGDAVYPSKYFPQSYLFTGEEGSVGQVPYDALQIAIEEAHKRSLRLEAWINPYRVRNHVVRELSSNNPARAMLESGDAIRTEKSVTYNPASEKAQKLIVDGVVELLEKYDVDGIHFDDYFYPTTEPTFDAEWYSAYKSGGGTKNLAEWRRSNVTVLVESVHNAIKTTKPSAVFGISPQGNMDNNLNAQFVDVQELISKELIDYICPQMYFGYQNSSYPYQPTIEDFSKMTKGTDVKLYVGLATYKFNKQDSWAGDGKNEWIGTTDILKRQVDSARALSEYGGFVLYRYECCFDPDSFYRNDKVGNSQMKTEMDNLKKLM